MANVLTRPVEESAFWSVPLLFACNNFIFTYDKGFMTCVAGRRVPLDDLTE